MVVSTILKNDIEKWWKHLDCPMKVMESDVDIHIGDYTFKPVGDKHYYHQKTRCTHTYIRTFQSVLPALNNKSEIIYPVLDIFVDMCEGAGRTTYKKVRCNCSC